jgi:hypothetical protein
MTRSKAKKMRDNFLAWQCRIRQIAMREQGGRPSPGMRPRLLDRAGRELMPALTVLLLPRDSSESTAFFCFQAMRSTDPRDVYERGLRFLQADFFQQPETFSDLLLAVLPENSEIVAAFAAHSACSLEFEQFSQSWLLPANAHILQADDPAREAAIWHNRLFNPALPETVHVVAFEPNWASAKSRKTVSL